MLDVHYPVPRTVVMSLSVVESVAALGEVCTLSQDQVNRKILVVAMWPFKVEKEAPQPAVAVSF
jgi:hypothetical protein